MISFGCHRNRSGIVGLKQAGVIFAIRRKLRREKGQGLVEYALILILVAVVVVGGLTLFGNSVSSLYTTIAGAP